MLSWATRSVCTAGSTSATCCSSQQTSATWRFAVQTRWSVLLGSGRLVCALRRGISATPRCRLCASWGCYTTRR